jgi:uncharacterized membrane protein
LFVASLVSLAPALAHAAAGRSGSVDWTTFIALTKLGLSPLLLGVIGLLCGLIGLVMAIADKSHGLPRSQGYIVVFIILLPAYLLLLLGIVWVLVPIAQVVMLFLYLGVRRSRLAGAGAKATPAAPAKS